MRIGPQSAEMPSKVAFTPSTAPKNTPVEMTKPDVQEVEVKVKQSQAATIQGESKEADSKDKLLEAVDVMNDLLKVQHKESKFVLHDGLDKYFVRLVDADTEEVIKEIPPERLLDAFYEMQKLAGMIVDEKV